MAQATVAYAAAVQAIITDLETSAKAGAKTTAEPVSAGDITDIGAILVQVEADLAGLSNDHYVGLSISRIGGPFLALTGEANARRMIGRLLTALVDVSEPGGVLVGQLVKIGRAHV